MDKNFLLLRTLLLSTSQVNIYKYTTDKKKKKRIIGGFIGVSILYLMIMGYSIAMCVGYGAYGMIDAAPLMCALIISALSFFFTIFKTNGYLFNFKEYDMLMSLPFGVRTVAGCKFLYMYVKSLPWYISISVSMLIGYGIFKRPGFIIYPLWIILSLILPIIPMLAASFLGFVIAKISAGFRKTNVVQTVLTFIFLIFCFSIQYIIDAVFKDDKVEATLEQTFEATSKAAGIYLPAKWFSEGITEGNYPGMLLLVVVSVALFAVVFYIVGGSYRNINSALKSHATAKAYKMADQKKRSVVRAIAWKEWKRMAGSTLYMTNVFMGEVLATILGILTLVIGFDKIVKIVTKGAPFDSAILYPAIPFIVYFFIGMMASTASSPSLEGKNYWIVQSLPIEKKVLYRGKMLFNICLSVPFSIISTFCICISARVPALEAILYVVLGIVLCLFSTTWGCVCGIKHMRLDWENEVEVVKQGTAVALYMLPNMFVCMGLIALSIFLGMKLGALILTSIFIFVAGLLAILCYLRVMALCKKQ